MGLLKRLIFGADDSHLTPAERMVKQARADRDCRIYVEQSSDGGIRFELEPLHASTSGLTPRKEKQAPPPPQNPPVQNPPNPGGGFKGKRNQGRGNDPNVRPN